MGIPVTPTVAGATAGCCAPAPAPGWEGETVEAVGVCCAPPTAPPAGVALAATVPPSPEVGRGSTCATDCAWLEATGRAVTPRSEIALCVVIGALMDPYAEVPEGVYKVAPGGGTGPADSTWLEATGSPVIPSRVIALCVVIGALVDPYAEVPEGVYKDAPGAITGGLGGAGLSGTPHTGTVVCVG